MNILIIPSWYPKDIDDIYGSFFREQALALTKIGNKVFVLNSTFTSFINAGKQFCTRITKQDDCGIIVYRKLIPSLGFSRYEKLCLCLFKHNILLLLKHLFHDYPEQRFDIIHAHSCYPAGDVACDIGAKFGIPVVITEHRSNYMRKEVSKPQRDILIKCLNNSSAFLCVGEGLKRQVTSITKCDQSKIVVVPNMFNDIFKPNLLKKAHAENYRFLSIGGLIPRKRHDQLIRCFSKAFNNIEGVYLDIIGDGPERESIMKQISSENLNKKVRLLGKKTREEVVIELQNSDAFVLTSEFETFGVVYIEAMACGLPVIGTRNGGADDLICPENGILIDVDNDTQLTNALLSMYENADMYDTDKIATSVQEKYSEKNVAYRLIDVYKECINQ